MFELDDSSLGHTDIYSNRYSDVGFSPMDFFVTDSLQDMLDIDIRSEVATVLGGNADIPMTLFNELPPLEIESPTLGSKYYYNMGHDDNMDLCGSDANSVMVDPSSVMPVLFTDVRLNKFGMLNFSTDSTDSSNLSSANKQSHFSFSPTKVNTLESTVNSAKQGSIRIRTDLTSETTSKKLKQLNTTVISKTSVKTNVNKPSEKTTFISGNIIVGQRGLLSSITSSPKPTNKLPPISKVTAKNNNIGYPKPAYSYSCLIAMALKNSKYGCLPVSEIYSFMCEHFPYFKTAPNGWKNSVRHNLSLNKCFEKIEKPATSGSQRKGCLWAMNPSKISKMDEEVQKWSRKDPMAIRKAMVFPETLVALERGEMKHSFQDEESILENDIEEPEDDEVEGSNSESGSEPEVEPEPEGEEEPDIEVDSGEEEEQENQDEYSDNTESEDEDGDVDVTIDSPIKLGNFKFEIINQIINNQPVELQLLQNKYAKENESDPKRSRVELQYSYVPRAISSTTPSRRKTPLTHRAT